MPTITSAMKLGAIAQFTLYITLFIIALIVIDTIKKAKDNLPPL